MGRPVICRICEQRIEGEEPVIIKVTGSSFYNKKAHAECYKNYLKDCGIQEDDLKVKRKKSSTKKEPKMTKEEIAERDELASYIKNLFGYHVLTRNHMHKINSLKNGEIVRKGDEITKELPYSVILLTFKAKKSEIDYALKNKHFNNEDGRFNYVMAIVSNSLNEVYLRWKDSEFQRRQLDRIHQAELESQEEGDIEQKEKYEFISNGRNPYLDNPLFADLWDD